MGEDAVSRQDSTKNGSVWHNPRFANDPSTAN
jgi:hypothetical protein